MEVLMIGTGEYTTGFASGGASKSDKSTGVVLLTMESIRRETGKITRLHLAGVNGKKFPAVRAHLQRVIVDAFPESEFNLDDLVTYPADDKVDPDAYKEALKAMPRGSIVTIFTPDNTHFQLALDSVNSGMHVLVTKPIVKTLAEHHELRDAAAKAGVLVMVEVHKRFDPIYVNAKSRIASMGDLGFFSSYMSQPKSQLETFKAWVGKGVSDISLYLNSHHVDSLEWMMQGRARPVRVVAAAATGVAKKTIGADTEDTITLTVTWENIESGTQGVSVHTASWAAPKSDVHSQQRFFFMGHGGELTVDQAHRGYSVSTHDAGFSSQNPLFWNAVPESGRFVGQRGYGYLSIAAFVNAAADVQAGKVSVNACDDTLPTAAVTTQTTAVLEAGRRSLDGGGVPINIVYDDSAAGSGSGSGSGAGAGAGGPKKRARVASKSVHPLRLEKATFT